MFIDPRESFVFLLISLNDRWYFWPHHSLTALLCHYAAQGSIFASLSIYSTCCSTCSGCNPKEWRKVLISGPSDAFSGESVMHGKMLIHYLFPLEEYE